jgi:hypothetical protein
VEVEHALRDFGLMLGAGLVAQFVATFLRVPEMIAVSLVALAVCATLLLQATTAGYVARRLDLLEEPEAPG